MTLTDFSEGMVAQARCAFGERAAYAIADVQALPFADASFDAVIANHMLFHVPDRERGLGEIARVLRPTGVLTATTIGEEHLQELRAPLADEHVIWSASRRRFGLETAQPQLERHFVDVEVERYPDELRVTEVEPLLDFVRSLDMPGLGEPELAGVERRASAAIAAEGAFRITKSTGRFTCRNP